MAQKPFIHISGGLYSVVSRCNNREFLFNSEEKFELYLRHLIYCKKKLGFNIYDIVCMSNHVHELYRVPEDGVTIADILQTVKGHFSQKYNVRYRRTDHFWRNKPSYRIVENEGYAFNICNYYHLNPVRAGLVDHPLKWPYSGYRFLIMGEKDGLIGKLLDPLPISDDNNPRNEPSTEQLKYIESLFLMKNLPFIGSRTFIRNMLKKYHHLPQLRRISPKASPSVLR